jgi:hypothetical protein
MRAALGSIVPNDVRYQAALHSDINNINDLGGIDFLVETTEGICQGKSLALSPMDIARFWGKVQVGQDFECWPWTGRTDDKGYGRAHGTRAHRIACALVHGPIPDELGALHSCDNPPCCNPFHLRAGTQQDNAQDALSRGRFSKGERNGNSKLTAAQVAYVIENPEGKTGTALAAQFGVAKSTISYVRSKRSWA